MRLAAAVERGSTAPFHGGLAGAFCEATKKRKPRPKWGWRAPHRALTVSKAAAIFEPREPC